MQVELSRIWIAGFIGRLTQAIWVQRGEAESRQMTTETIKRRSSEPGWPQMVIFPEGTNTNGKILIKFKSGAFVSGKPVQPVTITFPNSVDTLTWTWHQNYGFFRSVQ